MRSKVIALTTSSRQERTAGVNLLLACGHAVSFNVPIEVLSVDVRMALGATKINCRNCKA